MYGTSWFQVVWPCPAADHSVFVGDLAPDVTDYTLQEHFRHFFASVRSAKARVVHLTLHAMPQTMLHTAEFAFAALYRSSQIH